MRKADTERGGENIIQRGSTSGRSHSLCILNAWNEVTGLFDFALLVITLIIGGSWNLNCVQALQPQHSVAWWKAVIYYLPWSTNPINTAVKSDHVKTGPLRLLLIQTQSDQIVRYSWTSVMIDIEWEIIWVMFWNWKQSNTNTRKKCQRVGNLLWLKGPFTSITITIKITIKI